MLDLDARKTIKAARENANAVSIETPQVRLFFAMFRTMYPGSFNQITPTVEATMSVMRIYARDLNKLTTDQIENGFRRTSELRQQGDSRLNFPDVDTIIGVIKGSITKKDSAPAGIYRERSDLLSKPKRESSAEVAAKELDAIKELLEMQPGKVYSTAHKTPQAAWHQRLDSKERAQIMAKIQRNEAYRKKKYGLEIADLSPFENYFDQQEKTA